MKRYNLVTRPYNNKGYFRHSMKRDTMQNYFGTLIILLLTACSSVSVQAPEATQTSMMPPQVEPNQSDLSPMPQSTPFPSLEILITTATEDLARRLSIPISEIVLLDAQAVTWSDSSLGCPQPGMLYTDVLTSGYLILLSVNNKNYEYHTGRGSDIFLCENPTPPVPGLPGDT